MTVETRAKRAHTSRSRFSNVREKAQRVVAGIGHIAERVETAVARFDQPVPMPSNKVIFQGRTFDSADALKTAKWLVDSGFEGPTGLEGSIYEDERYFGR